MLELEPVFKGLSTAASVAKFIHSLIKSTRGTKRTLLIELKQNIQLIYLHFESGTPIDRVIAKLDSSYYKKAVESNFNFNSLQKAKLKEKLINNVPQYKHYVGWTTEQLFTNIYLKIHTLQIIVEIDAKNEKLRKNVRLINILKLMLLLLKHIK